ncbi:MAG: hypothetical protein HS108_05395 [Planctomycetes bacterium]|jgi:hypothetical protein|nr:hypothetical protein [Planctomycetota bacterium]MCL4730718.1 hypothetical protein [Planctomycetota bacterium]
MPRRRRRRFQLRLNARTSRLAAVAFLLALVGISLGCVVYEGRKTTPPAHLPPPTRDVQPLDALGLIEGWVPSWTDERAIVTQAADAGFHGVLLFHGTIKPDGRVVLEDPKGLASAVETAHARNLATWLTVTNHGADLSATLGRNLEAHLDSLVEAWRASGCGHLDLDYESLSLADVRNLESALDRLDARLEARCRLSLTLQPADSALRPDQLPVYHRMLAHPRVACVRLMAYDYHWKGSLPGALYPMPAFERLIEAYPEYRSKLVLCLPLYGYDWPRPEDCTIPQGTTVVLRDLDRHANLRAVWMRRDAELALFGDGRAVAAPSLRAVRERVRVMLRRGVPGVCFWHLGCAQLAPVAAACTDPARDQPEALSWTEAEGWHQWQTEFKQRVCRRHVARPGETLESIGRQYGVERAAMYRFNADLTNDGLAGKTVFVPQ